MKQEEDETGRRREFREKRRQRAQHEVGSGKLRSWKNVGKKYTENTQEGERPREKNIFYKRRRNWRNIEAQREGKSKRKGKRKKGGKE